MLTALAPLTKYAAGVAAALLWLVAGVLLARAGEPTRVDLFDTQGGARATPSWIRPFRLCRRREAPR
jgi:hypothetical protein